MNDENKDKYQVASSLVWQHLCRRYKSAEYCVCFDIAEVPRGATGSPG